MNIICLLIAILLLLSFWFLYFDIYFKGSHVKESKGEVVSLAETNNGITFELSINTEKGKKTGRTPEYYDIIPFAPGSKLPVCYVNFNVGKKEIFAVRINIKGIYKNESYIRFIFFAFIFIDLAIFL